MTHGDDSMTERVIRIWHELPVGSEIKAVLTELGRGSNF